MEVKGLAGSAGLTDLGRLFQERCGDDSIGSSFAVGTGMFSKGSRTAAAQGTAARMIVSAPLHENSRLCSLNTRTSECQVMGMIVLKSYIRGGQKKERRDSALQGGFWISTLPRLMLRKRVTKEMAGVGGWGQRSKVSEQ